jgi:hypothetical protein
VGLGTEQAYISRLEHDGIALPGETGWLLWPPPSSCPPATGCSRLA